MFKIKLIIRVLKPVKFTHTKNKQYCQFLEKCFHITIIKQNY